MSFKDVAKNNKKSLSLLSLAAILPFLGDSVAITLILNFQDLIAGFSIPQWVLFYFTVSFCIAFAFTHTTFVAIVSGFFLHWTALPYVILSYILALILGYFLAQKSDKGKLMDSLLQIPKAKMISEELKSNELKVIILARISPVLPFAMTNLFLAMLKADFRNYLAGGLIGMLPRTLLFIYTGVAAYDLTEAFQKGKTDIYSQVLIILLLILSVLGLIYYVIKATRKTKEASKE